MPIEVETRPEGAQAVALAGAAAMAPTGSGAVLIALPFYKNEALVAPVIESLIACAAELAAIRAEVLLFNDSPQYAPLQVALDAILPRAQAAFSCRLRARAISVSSGP